MDKNKKKLTVIFWIFVIFFFFIFCKAFKLQVIDREKLLARARDQFVREAKVYPKRGNIYDRNGTLLVINIPTYSIFTFPGGKKIDRKGYTSLAQIIPSLTYEKILLKINKRKRFTWLVRKISLDDASIEKIKKIPGIYIEKVTKRFYPNHELLSQILGFVGIDNNGLAGIEYLFNDLLQGEPIEVKYIVDNKGRAIKLESHNKGVRAQDVFLSIDKELQAASEKFLKEAVLKHGALKGGVGVMDAASGEILAMANYPSFNPNKISNSTEINRKLSFITDPFEPGSIFKTLTVASALEHNIVRLNTSYYCEQGQFLINDHEISEAGDKKQFEWLTVDEIIQYSSNIGITKIAFDLTYPKLRKTLIDFKIGQKSYIELPGESRGIFDRKTREISRIRLSNISFGQGVATTGIQMLSAYATIANDGIYHRPTIILNKNRALKGQRVISSKTVKNMTEMLLSAVQKGTGFRAKIPYFKIAGKTSTAQKPNKDKGYSGYIVGFIGFPVNVYKKFVIYVYIDDPSKGQIYGNTIAAPVFKKIAQHILYKDKDYDKLVLNTSDQIKDLKFIQSNKIERRIQGQNQAPNFIGLDKKSVKKLADKLNILLKHHGVGLSVRQEPLQGKSLKNDRIVHIYYSPPHYE